MKTKNTKKKSFFSLKISRNVFGLLVAILSSPIFVLLFFYFVFFGRFYPNTVIAGYNLSGLTKDEALKTLSEKIQGPISLTLTYNQQIFEINPQDFSFEYDFQKSLEENENEQKPKTTYDIVQGFANSFFQAKNTPLGVAFDSEKLADKVEKIAQQVNKNAKAPTIEVAGDKVVVTPGVSGEMVDEAGLANKIISILALREDPKITISTEFDNIALNQEEVINLTKRAENLLNKTLIISYEDAIQKITKGEIVNLVGKKEGVDNSEVSKLVDNFSQKVDRSFQNPVFTFEDGVVKEFVPAKDGLEVDKTDLTAKIIDSLITLENLDAAEINITPEVKRTKSEYQTCDVNSLGIKELLGRGVSHFAGSIASRVHNINTASAKFKGVLIKPGEAMSFNEVLGDVSAATGYQQAYVIKAGATVLGDGGGVCQVSTTLFRAALNAGLPIIERRAHAYRVGYYEQDSPPGLDATVYAPSPDLKIKNDTPGHVLVQASIDNKTKTLIFEIYGTSDGRVASISKPKIAEITPPPEDLYIDDPTLAVGQIKQIDWKASGAKVSFKYSVTRGGEVVYEKTFYSNYQPWQAKFLRGTGPVQ